MLAQADRPDPHGTCAQDPLAGHYGRLDRDSPERLVWQCAKEHRLLVCQLRDVGAESGTTIPFISLGPYLIHTIFYIVFIIYMYRCSSTLHHLSLHLNLVLLHVLLVTCWRAAPNTPIHSAHEAQVVRIVLCAPCVILVQAVVGIHVRVAVLDRRVKVHLGPRRCKRGHVPVPVLLLVVGIAGCRRLEVIVSIQSYYRNQTPLYPTHRRSLHLHRRHHPPNRHEEAVPKSRDSRALHLMRLLLIAKILRVERKRRPSRPLSPEGAARNPLTRASRRTAFFVERAKRRHGVHPARA